MIGGIQTVKAQHFELTARWKWQIDIRLVTEGFKSTALGATSGEIGGFEPSQRTYGSVGRNVVSFKGELTSITNRVSNHFKQCHWSLVAVSWFISRVPRRSTFNGTPE